MDILNTYRQRAEAAQAAILKYEKLVNNYSLLRLVVFALVVVAIYLSVKTIGFGLLVILFIVLMFCFARLVSRQSFFQERKNYFTALKTVIENEMGSIANGSNLYDDGSSRANEKHFYVSDLDIFGKGSLFQLINRAATSYGKGLLSAWLLAPSDKATILKRQESVKELTFRNHWKLDFQAKLLFANKADSGGLDTLFSYLRLPLVLDGEALVRRYITFAPFLLTAAIVTSLFYSIAWLAVIALGILNMSILTAKAGFIVKSGSIAGKVGSILSGYTHVFKTIEDDEWSSEHCREMAAQLRNAGAFEKAGELARLINKLDYNTIMIIGFILNIFFLWALKQVIAIEDWKRRNHQDLEAAVKIAAEFEALISISSLKINYPEWCFPEIADGEGYTLITRDIAHPLIGRDNRIANDYQLDEAFKIDIITGSNMAGKSTFLRTIGINTVLALCGAPVCAAEMKVSVVTIITYMRIKDSLNESTSTFKAELDRLQMLLTAVDTESKVFFLIDEMLRGTNSVDKYRGSKAVIEQLIHKRGVGMVATHDLQIADLEKRYPDYVRNFYFDIQVKDGEMLFDYKIKPGECKTFNASLLLKQIGIEVKD
ncbi:MAG TPA: hypothetical protein VHA56_21570 [Mucilaginibacter sp.]|nr:hypothetical protein [Mucilaginibacter sp.]